MLSQSLVVYAIIAVLLFAIHRLYTLLSPPPSFPKNIPTIPFYYSLLPLVRDVDQEELYRYYLKEPLAKYGAVKIFFGGRWNILVQRPSYLAEVFKYEDTYAKSGNQKKIPYGVLAAYTGDNIISAHGENWKSYVSVIKPGLQEDVPAEPIYRNVEKLLSLCLQEQKNSVNGSVMVMQPLQKYVLANLSQCLLGSDFKTLDDPNASMNIVQTQLKPHIFHPIFLNFPFLDRFKLASRQKARELVDYFHRELCGIVERSHQHEHDETCTHNLGCRMLAAKENQIWTDTQLRHNMTAVFLAGHENPQILLCAILHLLAEHQDIQKALRYEIQTAQGTSDKDYSKLQSLPFLTSVIYESLRLYPPISQLINRCTTENVVLGNDIVLPKDTYVGYNCYSTNHDPAFWGADADAFRPERWGQSMEEINALFRRANSKATFVSFHGGRRACLGQKFAMFQVRITVAELLKRVEWDLDPTWPKRMTPAGPLYARNLRIRFRPIA